VQADKGIFYRTVSTVLNAVQKMAFLLILLLRCWGL